MITREQLNEWKRLSEAATEGPLSVQKDGEGGFYIYSDVFGDCEEDGHDICYSGNLDFDMNLANIKLFAASRTAVPALCDEVLMLRRLLKKAWQVIPGSYPHNELRAEIKGAIL
jgi:hypothetical protein